MAGEGARGPAADSSARARFVAATGNAGKLREIARILPDFEILSLAGFAPVAFPDEGDDYATNARVKAQTVARATGLGSLADDSGIEVEALGFRPGPRSARYGGPGLADAERNALLIRELAAHPEPWRARFVCFAACAFPDGRTRVERGECAGRIVALARGGGGFGYDPIFVPDGFARTWAELDQSEKDRLSHRGVAFRALGRALCAPR